MRVLPCTVQLESTFCRIRILTYSVFVKTITIFFGGNNQVPTDTHTLYSIQRQRKFLLSLQNGGDGIREFYSPAGYRHVSFAVRGGQQTRFI